MYYRLSLEVRGLHNHLEAIEGMKFCLNAPRSAEVWLNRRYPDGSEASDASSVVCVGTTREDASDKEIVPDFEMALSASAGVVWPDGKGAVDAGRLPAIRRALDGVFRPLQSAMEAVVGVLRWRERWVDGPVGPFHSPKAYCSLDGAAWFPVSQGADSLVVSIGLACYKIKDQVERCREIVELIEARVEEPLGHQLFREAWGQRETHPRSALVIGVAAAEVGLKRLIGSLVPQAQWLVDELPAPPISKMLRDYLPQLLGNASVTGKSIRPSKVLVKRLEDAVACRNKVVHVGKAPPNRQDLDLMLRAVNDFLYICDVYGGHSWAQQHAETCTLSYPTKS